MTYHPDPHKAQRDLDHILDDLVSGRGPSGGATLQRTARRIRHALDCIMMEASAKGLPEDDNLTACGVEPPPVTEAAATFLTVYHLQMAATYFEAAGPELELEIARGFGAGRSTPPLLGHGAARAWLKELTRAYDALDDEPDAI